MSVAPLTLCFANDRSCGGYGDRLVAIASVKALCDVVLFRPFQVVWNRGVEEGNVDEGHVFVFRDEGISKIAEHLREMQSVPSNVPIRIKTNMPLTAALVGYGATPRSEAVLLHATLSAYRECMNEVYVCPTMRTHAKDALDAWPNTFAVGVHVRLGDTAFLSRTPGGVHRDVLEHLDAVVECIVKCLVEQLRIAKGASIFFVSSSQRTIIAPRTRAVARARSCFRNCASAVSKSSRRTARQTTLTSRTRRRATTRPFWTTRCCSERG